jgi:hypothetical protein
MKFQLESQRSAQKAQAMQDSIQQSQNLKNLHIQNQEALQLWKDQYTYKLGVEAAGIQAAQAANPTPGIYKPEAMTIQPSGTNDQAAMDYNYNPFNNTKRATDDPWNLSYLS